MSIDDTLQKARSYIKLKEYHKARKLLKPIQRKSVTASAWLDKLDRISPSRNRHGLRLKLSLLFLLVIMAMILWFAALQPWFENNQQSADCLRLCDYNETCAAICVAEDW